MKQKDMSKKQVQVRMSEKARKIFRIVAALKGMKSLSTLFDEMANKLEKKI